MSFLLILGCAYVFRHARVCLRIVICIYIGNRVEEVRRIMQSRCELYGGKGMGTHPRPFAPHRDSPTIRFSGMVWGRLGSRRLFCLEGGARCVLHCIRRRI